MGCVLCGAAIELSTTVSVKCRFCEAVNPPLARERPVPVPVQVVHNVVNVATTAEAPAEVRCPHCKKRLVGVRAEDVELHGCGGCGGIWVDNASARRILDAPLRIFTELADRAAGNARTWVPRTAHPACATCPAVMDRVRVHGIELDVCLEHGTWFDPRELAVLTRHLRGEATPRSAFAAPAGDVTCTACHRPGPADRMNVTDDGAMCDACWRERQRERLATAEAEHMKNAGGAVAAMLLVGLTGAALAGNRRS